MPQGFANLCYMSGGIVQKKPKPAGGAGGLRGSLGEEFDVSQSNKMGVLRGRVATPRWLGGPNYCLPSEPPLGSCSNILRR